MATKEQQAKWSKEWAKKNPEKVAAAKKRYQEKNKERIAAERRAYRKENREKLDLAIEKWRKNNPDIVSMQRARRRIKLENSRINRELRFHYDVTLESYRQVEKAQAGICLICGEAEVNKKIRRLVVDHDHAHGTLRGLLCHRCNCGLGYFRDRPDLIRRALSYLCAFNSAGADRPWIERVEIALSFMGDKHEGSTDIAAA